MRALSVRVDGVKDEDEGRGLGVAEHRRDRRGTDPRDRQESGETGGLLDEEEDDQRAEDDLLDVLQEARVDEAPAMYADATLSSAIGKRTMNAAPRNGPATLPGRRG